MVRKSYIFIVVGGIIILTSILCLGENRDFQKKIFFKTPVETIQYLTTHTLYAVDGMDYVESEMLKECISKRKRIYGSNINWQDIKKIEELSLSDDAKTEILRDYQMRASSLKGYTIPNNAFVYSFIGEVVPLKDLYLEGKEDFVASPNSKFKFNLVLIDEGEGYVVDYLTYSDISVESINGRGGDV